MIVSLTHDAQEQKISRQLAALGLWVDTVTRSQERTHLLLAPHSSKVTPQKIMEIHGVYSVATPNSSHPKVDQQGARVSVGNLVIGGKSPVLFCGPCAVESKESILQIASMLSSMGVHFLRGGAFKPRSSPYSFQGHGEKALRWLRDAADRYGMKVVTEAMGDSEAPLVAEYADMVQVGSRNMQNFSLLKAVGRTKKPVLLKRSMSATLEEWLLAAEYLLVHGAAGVVFCERGIRSFDTQTRFLLDLSTVALLQHVYHLPVIVDPSHGTGRRELIAPLARAALAAGASGLMIETHSDPKEALSDGPQALYPAELSSLLQTLPLGSSYQEKNATSVLNRKEVR